MREAFFGLSTDWKEGINWANVRDWRLKRAHAAMERHGLGALLLMYDENMRYVSSTLTPGWNRLKPGLRYVVLTAGQPPIVYEQGDIGFHLEVHNPWIPKENIRYSYSWIKGAAGPAAEQQVTKFVDSLLNDLEQAGVKDQPLGVDFIDINLVKKFEERGISWTDGMTPMMEARAIKSPDEIKAFSIVGAICDYVHYEITNFIKPGLTENEVAAFGSRSCTPCRDGGRGCHRFLGPNAWPNWRNFDRMIRPGELVIVDLAALTWNGFKSCYRPTVGGKPTDEHQKTYDLAHKWLWDSIEATKPGVTTADVASVAVNAKWDEEHQPIWGHGLGLAQYDRRSSPDLVVGPSGRDPARHDPLSRPNTENSTITVCVSKKCST